MAMFERVMEHVIANAGSSTLHAVADINSAERYSTLCIVERRKSFWFWKNPSMVPTFVTLKDLLIRNDDLSAKEKEFTLLKKLADNPKLNMSGSVQVSEKLAKKIAGQVDISLGGHDQMNLDINLGDIVKREVPFESLRDALNSNPIDTTHPLYVAAARKSPKSSLCVVMESLSTKDVGKIKEDDDWKVDTSAGANVIKIDVRAKGSVESKCTRSYSIPPGTVIAYSCIEMDVDPNGVINLHVTEDTLDQSNASLQLPENPFTMIHREFEPLISSDKIVNIQEEVKSLLSGASETDFRVMHILLYYANIGKETYMPESKLKHLMGVDISYSWKGFMTLLGFSIEEDANGGGTVILYPNNTNDGVLKACLPLIDSILDCFSKNWKTIPQLSQHNTHVIMKVIEKEFKGKANSLHDTEVNDMIKSDPKTMDFLKGCGFKQSVGSALTFTGKNSFHLLDIYAIMYFLTVGSSGHCNIL